MRRLPAAASPLTLAMPVGPQGKRFRISASSIVGFQGLLFTCDADREKNASRDALRLLTQVRTAPAPCLACRS